MTTSDVTVSNIRSFNNVVFVFNLAEVLIIMWPAGPSTTIPTPKAPYSDSSSFRYDYNMNPKTSDVQQVDSFFFGNQPPLSEIQYSKSPFAFSFPLSVVLDPHEKRYSFVPTNTESESTNSFILLRPPQRQQSTQSEFLESLDIVDVDIKEQQQQQQQKEQEYLGQPPTLSSSSSSSSLITDPDEPLSVNEEHNNITTEESSDETNHSEVNDEQNDTIYDEKNQHQSELTNKPTESADQRANPMHRKKICFGCGVLTDADVCIKCPELGRKWFGDICLKPYCTKDNCKYAHEGQTIICTYCRTIGHSKRFCANANIACSNCHEFGHWTPINKVPRIYYLCGQLHQYQRKKVVGQDPTIYVWKRKRIVSST
jgi:hypothetical protein